MSESMSSSNASSSALFQPSPTPRASFGTVLLFLLTSVLVLAGFWVMSLAFSHQDFGIELFAAGLLLDTLGFWLAFGIIPSRG